jgi:hypothetical protein
MARMGIPACHTIFSNGGQACLYHKSIILKRRVGADARPHCLYRKNISTKLIFDPVYGTVGLNVYISQFL